MPFRDCPSGFLNLLALAMTVAELQPKEEVLKRDEYGEIETNIFVVLSVNI